jgi:hypothetical protein
MMVYYGAVKNNISEFKGIYSFLKKSLLRMPKDYPYRGPKSFKEKEWQYINKWNGEVDQFSGEETILKDKKIVFWTKYIGGLVNIKK